MTASGLVWTGRDYEGNLVHTQLDKNNVLSIDFHVGNDIYRVSFKDEGVSIKGNGTIAIKSVAPNVIDVFMSEGNGA